jgi:hypothetical protein
MMVNELSAVSRRPFSLQTIMMLQISVFLLAYCCGQGLALNPSALSSSTFSMPSEQLVEWDVYVDQSRSAVARGSTATLDAFVGLCPPSVQVHPSVIASSPRAKSPVVRCQSRTDPDDCLEIINVDSVDKVYRILTRHLNVKVSGQDYTCIDAYFQC